MTSEVDLNALIEALELPDDERDALEAAVLPIPPEHGMRGLWFKPLPTRLAVRSPELAERFLAWAEPLGQIGAFSWMPMSWAVLSLVRAATLVYPDPAEPAIERCRRYMDADSQNALENTMLRSMVMACGNDLAAFLETTIRGAEMFYNHGELSIERLRRGEVVVHAEGHHAQAEAYFVPGYYDGIVRHFDAKGARFEIYGPTRWSMIITL